MYFSLISLLVALHLASAHGADSHVMKHAKTAVQKKLTASRMSQEKMMKHIMPKSLKGHKIEAAFPKPLTMADRFLEAVLPDGHSKGHLIFRFFQEDKKARDCHNSAYTGEMGLFLDTCWKVSSETSNIQSIMIEASNYVTANGTDYVTTLFKAFTDNKCQVQDPASFPDDTKMYDSMCTNSPITEFGFAEGVMQMQVEYKKSTKFKMSKVKADKAVASGYVYNRIYHTFFIALYHMPLCAA